jgi:hypothetical protein
MSSIRPENLSTEELLRYASLIPAGDVAMLQAYNAELCKRLSAAIDAKK